MFSSLARRISPRLIDRLDLMVELSTLGEYGVDGEGLFALETPEEGMLEAREAVAAPACARPSVSLPRLRQSCPPGAAVSPVRAGATRP